MNDNECCRMPATLNYEIECERLREILQEKQEETDKLYRDMDALRRIADSRLTKYEEMQKNCEILKSKLENEYTENKRLYEQNLRLERQVDGFVMAFRALMTRSGE